MHPRLFPDRTYDLRAPYSASESSKSSALAAARAYLVNPRGHPHDYPLILSSARSEQHNHRDECDEQHDFHGVAPSSLLGAAARQELQRIAHSIAGSRGHLYRRSVLT